MFRNKKPPLVVDLDGTLTMTDTLHESIVEAIKKHPSIFFKIPFWILKGRVYFKEKIAEFSCLSPKTLPYHENLLDYIKDEKSQGREVYLATAAHVNIANAVANHHAMFDGVLASSHGVNLKGSEKLRAIKELIGNEFVYAGNSKDDIPIWNESTSTVLVNAPSKVAKIISASTNVEKEFVQQKSSIKVWLKAIRVHQWLKNILLFVPIVTSFTMPDAASMMLMSLSFLSFSLTASATYILNDIWDVESDRNHPRKKFRPFASSSLSIINGIAASITMLFIGVAISLFVSVKFSLLLISYLILTTLYSFILKQKVLIDVMLLSILYTLRIIAGSIALDIKVSSWLLIFSIFIFLSLALVKRCSELVSMRSIGIDSLQGRGYKTSDLVVLWPFGISSSLCSIVVFELFINTPETISRYLSPELLFGSTLLLTYWLLSLWIRTSRGEMHDDPIVFAIKDRGSQITLAIMLFIIYMAHSIDIKGML